MAKQAALKIGIIGGGYSGTTVAATLIRKTSIPLDITIYDKSGEFGVGEAYRTTFPYHLLNVRAKDMSAFADEPSHFVEWLIAAKHRLAVNREMIAQEFVPRYLYRLYLQQLLNDIQSLPSERCRLTLEKAEATDLYPDKETVIVQLNDGRTQVFDKMVLAIGNGAASGFPFPVDPVMQCITSSWHYDALRSIPVDDAVMIAGTGLSMIDAVLTLHHQGHQGQIYAVSRHGLLPLSHERAGLAPVIELTHLPDQLRALARHVRKAGVQQAASGDWRSVINAMRNKIPEIWQHISLNEKKRFMRHLLPYWNIFRHRVHTEISDLLVNLKEKNQLKIVAGRLLKAEASQVIVKQRGTGMVLTFDVKWLINCMGPPASLAARSCSLVQSLKRRKLVSFDPLALGFAVSPSGAIKDIDGHISDRLYTLGPPARGEYWECTAVPDIRQYCAVLAEHLIK